MALLIPKVLYGPYKDVIRASKKMARALHKGEEAVQVFAAEGFVNQAEHKQALIYTLSHAGRGTVGEDFFPSFPLAQFSTLMFNDAVLGHASSKAEAESKVKRLIGQLLPHQCGVLALLMDDTSRLWSYLTDPVREGAPPDPLLFQFLEKLCVYWEEFYLAGYVYVSGVEGEALDKALTSLSFVALNLGVPEDLARYPQTAYLEAYAIHEKKRLERLQA